MNYSEDHKFLTHALLEFKEIFKLAEYCILIDIEDTIDITVGFNYGISIYPESATDIKDADEKMYDYKESLKKN